MSILLSDGLDIDDDTNDGVFECTFEAAAAVCDDDDRRDDDCNNGQGNDNEYNRTCRQ